MTSRLWEICVSSFSKILIPGLTVTIPLTAVSFILALIIAVICALIRYAKIPVLREIVRFYVWVIRGTPLLVQLYVVFYGLPNLGVMIDPLPCAIMVFAINEGAYCTETIRGSLEAVPITQIEAGRSLGLGWVSTMRLIALPQAMRSAFPALSNSLISMLKDTSLASGITVTEMFMTTQRIAGRYYEYLALYIEVALIYLIFCTILQRLQARIEKRLSRYEL